MQESVTSTAALSQLLDRRTAKQHLSVLASRSMPDAGEMLSHIDQGSERKRVELLLDIVNDRPRSLPPDRCAALRAFLEERVAVRERTAMILPRLVQEDARHGLRPVGKLPHRTVALSIAAEGLPPLLSGRVHKSLSFQNAGAARIEKGRLKSSGEAVSVVLEGAGGELVITERMHCDSAADALNFSLALAVAKNRPYGEALCRCHAEGCGRFWLLPEKLSSKPTRNFCSLHEAEKKRLSDVERKRRQRKKDSEIEPSSQRAKAKHK